MKRIVCPACWTSSPNADDVAHGYCGRCHAFTSGQVIDDEATPLGRVRLEWSDGTRRPVDLDVQVNGIDEDGHAVYAAEIPPVFTLDVLRGAASARLDTLPGLTSLRLGIAPPA